MRLILLIVVMYSSVLLKSQTCTLYIDSTADCGLICIGTATAYPTGQAPFTYLWQPGGQTTQQISNLCPGSYTVTVTDSLGCVTIDSVTINGSPILNVWISSATSPSCVGCNDGSAGGSVNGGTPGYYPYWMPPIGFGLYNISGVGAGTYQFCVIDTFGCESCVDTLIQDPLDIPENSELFSNLLTVEIFDLTGRLVWAGSYNGWLMTERIELPPATYIMIGKDASGGVVVRKTIQ